jgi:hypothetical protein
MTHLLSTALLVLMATVVTAQDDSPKTRKVNVKVKVSAKDGQVPSGTTVEISGQELACGSLNSNDATAGTNGDGEAMFQNLPACKVSVKTHVSGNKVARKLVDLTDYKSCAARPPGESGPAQPPCDPVVLELEPL